MDDDIYKKPPAATSTSATTYAFPTTGITDWGYTDWSYIPTTTTSNTFTFPWNQVYGPTTAATKVPAAVNTKMIDSKHINRHDKKLDLSKLTFTSVLGRENFPDGTTVYTVEMRIGATEFTDKISRTKDNVYYIIPEMIEIPTSKNNKLAVILNKYDNFAALVNSVKLNKIKSFNEDIIKNIIE